MCPEVQSDSLSRLTLTLAAPHPGWTRWWGFVLLGLLMIWCHGCHLGNHDDDIRGPGDRDETRWAMALQQAP